MNILMIGNSYTYVNALDQLLQELCRENGKQVNAWRVTKGGRRLEAYMDPEDETTQKLEAILQERRYDVCFLQEQSLTPILDYDAFLSGLTHVMRMVGKQADRFLLYATWSRATGSTTLDAHSWTPEVMTHLLEDAYQKAGQQLEVPVSPVGTSFWKVVKARPFSWMSPTIPLPPMMTSVPYRRALMCWKPVTTGSSSAAVCIT